MRNTHATFAVGAVICTLLSLSRPVWALSNGSFETGDLSGWSASNPSWVDVVDSHADPDGTGTTSWAPVEGNWFARVGASSNVVTLQQTFAAQAGDRLSLWWFWDSQVSFDIDEASGLIRRGGNTVHTLFEVAAVDDPAGEWGTDWAEVGYTFASSGMYDLAITVDAGSESGIPPYVGVDAISLTPAAVIPEPLTAISALLACGALGRYLRRR